MLSLSAIISNGLPCISFHFFIIHAESIKSVNNRKTVKTIYKT
jgi:hypothetical protein